MSLALTLSAPNPVRSLVWAGERLFDPIQWWSVGLDGSSGYGPDGRSQIAFGLSGVEFDAAAVSPSGTLMAVYQRLGTKAVLLDMTGNVVRELDRSYYQAEVYEYPLAFGTLPDGTEVLAHCPDAYNRIVIETAHQGQRLASATAAAEDVFHSRLAFSPDGRHLASAGWVWAPASYAWVFDVTAALADGTHLNRGTFVESATGFCEVEAVCWLDHGRLLWSTSPGDGDFGPDDQPWRGRPPGTLHVHSVTAGTSRPISRVSGHSQHTGTLHAAGSNVLALYGYPRLLEPDTGEVLATWPDLHTGQQTSSITWHLGQQPPPTVFDAHTGYLAVAEGAAIHVARLDSARQQ